MKPLWPHQEFGLAEMDRLAAAGARNICLTTPTGGGKSRTMYEHIAAGALPTALYTDRRMLFAQIGEGLDSFGIQYGYRAAGYDTSTLRDVQLCMVQTEGSRVLNGNRSIHRSSRVYIDEAHKNAGDTMQRLIAQHRELVPDMTTYWVTATPLGLDHVCDELIIAGTNSQLRECGALLLAEHYGPDEPDTKWVGRVTLGEGECGLPNSKRMDFAHRVFGSVVEHYLELNPEQRPAILFAPGVKESIWFAEELEHNGISAAHIDGENVWLDGHLQKKTQDLVDEIAERHRTGDIKVVCNRFVLREGIDWPWIYHGIFATVFGSLTSYIQAGGRILRNHESLPGHVVLQDHGGNWWRHGSLNSNREWKLEYTDRIVAGMREKKLREKSEPEPFTCPKCHALRTHGDTCWQCGYRHTGKSRRVLQKDGTMREMAGDIYRRRRVLPENERVRRDWCGYVQGIQKSKKPTVQAMTFAQAEANFARRNNWQYPPHTLPMMPSNEVDWFRPVQQVSPGTLTTGAPANREMAAAEAEGW